MARSVAEAFDAVVASLDDAMFVVSAAASGEVAACLVGFATQCSIEPPRFLVCLSKNNRTYEVACRAEALAVHRLRAEQHELAELLGGTSAKDEPGKLASCSWRPGPGGAPVLEDTDWFAGRVLDRVATGDHVAFVLEPIGGEHRPGVSLGYQRVADVEAGQDAG